MGTVFVVQAQTSAELDAEVSLEKSDLCGGSLGVEPSERELGHVFGVATLAPDHGEPVPDGLDGGAGVSAAQGASLLPSRRSARPQPARQADPRTDAAPLNILPHIED